MLSYFANPQRFLALVRWALPVSAVLAAAGLGLGLPWALLFAPADYLQGESVRIMFVHVPAASWAMGAYLAMGVASLIYFVWRHTLADLAARAIAPMGAALAAACLISGSFWGRPTWGTWWEWDARLTSMLFLFLTYLGYLALRAAIEDEGRAARFSAILAMAGAINLPIIHFSVDWWNTLHQPSSLLRAGGPSITPSLLWPLLVMSIGVAALLACSVLVRMRADILQRRAQARGSGATPAAPRGVLLSALIAAPLGAGAAFLLLGRNGVSADLADPHWAYVAPAYAITLAALALAIVPPVLRLQRAERALRTAGAAA